jgi:mono/diheme cytochrome c family protein
LSVKVKTAGLALALVSLLAGCRQDMHNQPKYTPLRSSDFFPDGRSARAPVPGTVARGQLRDNSVFYTGKVGDQFAAQFPMPVTLAMLERGQERYNIYCAPCHALTGNGFGLVVQRGFRRPVSFHDPRLRAAPPGYYFDAMTRGFGAMSDYAAQLSPADRWAIAAYVRALQFSQHASLADLPPVQREQLMKEPAPETKPAESGKEGPPPGVQR